MKCVKSVRFLQYQVSVLEVLRQIWGCSIQIEIKSPFSLTAQSLPYHTFAA